MTNPLDVADALRKEGYAEIISEWQAGRILTRYGVPHATPNYPRRRTTTLMNVARELARHLDRNPADAEGGANRHPSSAAE